MFGLLIGAALVSSLTKLTVELHGLRRDSLHREMVLCDFLQKYNVSRALALRAKMIMAPARAHWYAAKSGYQTIT